MWGQVGEQVSQGQGSSGKGESGEKGEKMELEGRMQGP